MLPFCNLLYLSDSHSAIHILNCLVRRHKSVIMGPGNWLGLGVGPVSRVGLAGMLNGSYRHQYYGTYRHRQRARSNPTGIS